MSLSSRTVNAFEISEKPCRACEAAIDAPGRERCGEAMGRRGRGHSGSGTLIGDAYRGERPSTTTRDRLAVGPSIGRHQRRRATRRDRLPSRRRAPDLSPVRARGQKLPRDRRGAGDPDGDGRIPAPASAQAVAPAPGRDARNAARERMSLHVFSAASDRRGRSGVHRWRQFGRVPCSAPRVAARQILPQGRHSVLTRTVAPDRTRPTG